MTETHAVHARAVELCRLALRSTTAAGSGHPTSGMALAHIVALLMDRHLRWKPHDPWDPSADRLVLSAGHAVPIIYAAYALHGGLVGRDRESARPLTVGDLDQLRALDSPLDGHPNPAEGFPFFDAATGSLGQGLSVAAGLALAARLSRIDKRIFCLIGDGESREGQIWEAADFIVDHRLANVCAIVSCNGQGQADAVSPQQSADAVQKKYEAFGWETAQIDGHEPAAVDAALARAGTTPRPFAIVARTIKGWGSPTMQFDNWHGKPASSDQLPVIFAELDATAAELSADPARSAPIAPAAPAALPKSPAALVPTGPSTLRLPPLAEGFAAAGLTGALNKNAVATRRAYGAALLAAGLAEPRVVALDGDTRNSTFSEYFLKKIPHRFFEGKIAEQNMISTAVGLAAAGFIPFANSFAKFITRGYDQIEMATITRANIKIVGSHSGVTLAADGPSQMGLSDVAFFRSFTHADEGRGHPAALFFHPADAVAAYRFVELMVRHVGLCYMRTHRADMPLLYPHDASFEIGGFHVLRPGRHLSLVAAGYMVHEALRSAQTLATQGIEAQVIDAYTFPLRSAPLLEKLRAAGGAALTLEDNYLGGLHGAVAEAAAEAGEIRVVGMTCTRIPKSGRKPDEVLAYVGLSHDEIIRAARRLIG